MHDLHVITRELINEMLTPEEEREWQTYLVHLPKAELEEAREHLVAASVVTQAMVRLMNEGATPESEGVQKLLLQSNQLMLKYHMRERLLRRGDWNATVTRKVHAMGHRLVMKSAAPDGSVAENDVFDFCCRARKASRWGKLLDAIVDEALVLAERKASAHSRAAQALAQRLMELCEPYALGDPVLYGRWFIEFGRIEVDGEWVPVDEQRRAAWMLLISAAEVAREPGVRVAAAW